MSLKEGATNLEAIAFLSTQPEGLWDIKPHKKEASLSAKGYYWSLVEKIAHEKSIVTGSEVDKLDIHREIMEHYGVWEHNDDGSAKWEIKPINYKRSQGEYLWTDGTLVKVQGENSGEDTCQMYVRVKPSEFYEPAEYNGIIRAAKDMAIELEIDVRTPKEIEKLESYERNHK